MRHLPHDVGDVLSGRHADAEPLDVGAVHADPELAEVRLHALQNILREPALAQDLIRGHAGGDRADVAVEGDLDELLDAARAVLLLLARGDQLGVEEERWLLIAQLILVVDLGSDGVDDAEDDGEVLGRDALRLHLVARRRDVERLAALAEPDPGLLGELDVVQAPAGDGQTQEPALLVATDKLTTSTLDDQLTVVEPCPTCTDKPIAAGAATTLTLVLAGAGTWTASLWTGLLGEASGALGGDLLRGHAGGERADAALHDALDQLPGAAPRRGEELGVEKEERVLLAQLLLVVDLGADGADGAEDHGELVRGRGVRLQLVARRRGVERRAALAEPHPGLLGQLDVIDTPPGDGQVLRRSAGDAEGGHRSPPRASSSSPLLTGPARFWLDIARAELLCGVRATGRRIRGCSHII
ncbi:hypothetical protein EJB05_32370 [Eragrostis curvula]|uniref:Uncharacterized protein n=1 Tax=Eragrostis curvula TaxID=38414 RepID=A0A5J9UFX7_9POAL|nr:hypothetical protein EJB05_32370 [Eragrostis curvula]